MPFGMAHALIPPAFSTLAPSYALRLCRWWIDRALRDHLRLAYEQFEETDEVVRLLQTPFGGEWVRHVTAIHEAWAEANRPRRVSDKDDASTWYRPDAVARMRLLGAFNGTITDVDLLFELTARAPVTTGEILDAFLDVGSLGAEACAAAAELVSPAIFAAERFRRRHDIARIAFTVEDV